ncbi:MAG: ABC transporter ATP-binding protein [Alphaproteobacteria bacterium]|nr:ABC transporter ATP-binding protein [Alphaproteobacteria bacterium]
MTGGKPIEIKDASAGYGGPNVFEHLSLSIEAGEIFGLIGLNGVGKTTLIKALLGLGEASGSFTFFGEDASLPKSRRHLAYLPEKFMPSHLLSGWEFLEITLDYYGLKLDQDRARALALGLALDPEALAKRGRQLSKGMGQKLGLMATLLTGLPLLILDEPMSGLDPRSRILLKDRLVEYRARGGTVFFSSHILADIEEICGRIGILHAGRLIYVGTPDAFIAKTGAASLERAFLAAITEAESQGRGV